MVRRGAALAYNMRRAAGRQWVALGAEEDDRGKAGEGGWQGFLRLRVKQPLLARFYRRVSRAHLRFSWRGLLQPPPRRWYGASVSKARARPVRLRFLDFSLAPPAL